MLVEGVRFWLSIQSAPLKQNNDKLKLWKLKNQEFWIDKREIIKPFNLIYETTNLSK